MRKEGIGTPIQDQIYSTAVSTLPLTKDYWIKTNLSSAKIASTGMLRDNYQLKILKQEPLDKKATLTPQNLNLNNVLFINLDTNGRTSTECSAKMTQSTQD